MKKKWKLKKTLTVIGPKPKTVRVPKVVDPSDDPKHLAWIRDQPCAVRTYPFLGATRCRGRTEAHHHTGGRGRSKRSDDRRAFPLCARHHRPEFHDEAPGSFTGWSKAKRRAWQDEMVARYVLEEPPHVQAFLYRMLEGAFR